MSGIGRSLIDPQYAEGRRDGAADFPTERVAAARHRMLHPTYPRYHRCDCPGFARKLAEADAMLREQPQ